MADTEDLLSGFARFRQEYFGQNSENRLYHRLSNGQKPKTLMIACCDSRVDPALLTDCNPGDLFTVRNVANLVPPCEDDGHYHGTSAAIEFAVLGLEVQNIIVMGHAKCGGIHALWHESQQQGSQFIHRWVQIAQPAKNWVLEAMSSEAVADPLRACEQRSIVVSLENLMSFPAVRQRVDAGRLSLHGWYFDLAAGELLTYDPLEQCFVAVQHP